MNDLTITVTGWVATTPSRVVRKDGKPTNMCTFRVAQTPRFFDRDNDTWVNKKTEWFDVRARGNAALFVESSIEKGQPVIVTGRLQTDEWQTAAGDARFAVQVNATAIGHDLSLGVAKFSRAVVENESIERLSAKDGAATSGGAEGSETEAATAGDGEASANHDVDPDLSELNANDLDGDEAGSADSRAELPAAS